MHTDPLTPRHRLVSAALVALAAATTSEAVFARGPVLAIDQRIVAGVDDVRGLTLGIDGLGSRWHATPTLDVHVEALTLRTAGSTALGEPAAIGFGGEVGLRVAPWDTARTVRPYLGASVGLLAFPGRSFLPGGAAYEGLVTFSLGADVRIDSRLSAGARGFAAHLSNGQGLGPHNPAYDGYGGAVELAWDLDPPPPGPVAPPARDARTGRESTTPGATLDLEVGRFGDGLLAAGRVRGVQRVGRETLVLAEAECGSADRLAFGEVGGALIAHLGAASVGAYSAYRGYAGSHIHVVTAQIEGHVTQELSLLAMAHHEGSAELGSVYRGAIGGRAFPIAGLAIDLGVGFDRIGDDTTFGKDHADPYLGLEWQVPWHPGSIATSVFVERQVSTLDLVGIRVSFDGGADLRALARHDGWRRLR